MNTLLLSVQNHSSEKQKDRWSNPDDHRIEPSVFLFAWQRPTLPGGRPPSTLGAEELNFRVRDGYGCVLFAIVTRLLSFAFRLLSGTFHSLKTGSGKSEDRSSMVKGSTDSYPSAPCIAALPPRTDLPRLLQGVLPEISS